HRGFHVIKNYLLERDMDDVELRRLGPRDHPFLAMPTQINVSANVVRIAKMIDEPDQGIDHVALTAFLVVLGVPVDDVSDRISPLLHDSVEVAIDQVRRLFANLDALWRATPDCRTPQARERLLDLGELIPDILQFFGGRLDGRVGRYTVFDDGL